MEIYLMSNTLLSVSTCLSPLLQTSHCTNLLKLPSKVWSGTLTCTPCFSPPGSGEPGGRGLGQPGASEPPSHSAARRWDIFIMAWQTARFLPQRKGPNILSNPKVVHWQREKLPVHLKDHNKFVAKGIALSLCLSPRRHDICPKFYTAEISSIKHDLARSRFQLWPKIGDEGDKISIKYTPLSVKICFLLWKL